MAEARRAEEEGSDLLRDARNRSQATDHPERPKPEHLHSSPGPLSSIRAAIKRTRTNCQGDYRRRPEITIVSAEPLANNSWFSGASVVFHPPQSSWSAGIQPVSQLPPSYDQVIQEKTQEEDIVKPIAAPRQTTCTTTSATQTDSVRKDSTTAVPQCIAAPRSAETRSAGKTSKKPQKPPRPSPPKPVDREQVAAIVGPTDRKIGTNTTLSINPVSQSYSKSDSPKQADSNHTCTRSVTVHWYIPTKQLSDSVAPAETVPTSDSEPSQRPIPLPRTKSRKQEKQDVQDQTLVRLSENCDNIHTDPQEVKSNKYLKELLDAFSVENECADNCLITNQSHETPQGGDAFGEMNISESQRNIRAKIQAFESQSCNGEENGAEPAKPDFQPRRPSIKPPVAAKPSVAFKPQFNHNVDDSQNISTINGAQNSTPAPRPQPTQRSVGLPIKEELESLHIKAAMQNRSRAPVLTRANSVYEADTSLVPPIPPARPYMEPLRPSLNINNHNSASIFSRNENVTAASNHLPVNLQHSVDSNGGSFNRPNITRRPTTIRVPSKTVSLSDEIQDSPPPLPAQKPIGSFNNSVNYIQSPPQVLPVKEPFQFGSQPSLPPRRPSTTKPLPPHAPQYMPGPGRPPIPSLQAAGRSVSEPFPKPHPQTPHTQEPVLPPRPKPGQRLYNKYILERPHGIAAYDYNGSNTGELSFEKNEVLLLLGEIDRDTFECQVGEARGRVNRSHMKIITPLDPPQDDGLTGQRVQAIHDFVPGGPGELGLRLGDTVTMVEQVDSEWYRGTCRGSTGFFPINHVKVLSNSPKMLPERKPQPAPAAISGPRCVARFNFEGQSSDELSFSEGSVIELKEHMGQDWAWGQIGASAGIFPLNYVDIIEDIPPPPSQQQKQPTRIALPGMVASPAAKSAQASQSSVNWVVAQYNYVGKSDDELSFRKGDCILITQHIDGDWSCGRLNGKEGMFPRAFVENTTGLQSSNTQQYEAVSSGRARALYNFTSNCDEELSLQAGDIITNLESIDEEWYLGDSRGKRALVPKNYVQVLG
ncbi:SH3 domain-containing protein 19 isoform X2 [Mastacembelus armatus]|uniref:SH3 domain-containing protein 19 isoform X2 n=1 Tax=Mastacembelus armatus TaxID=205130 RepID=UPI000E4612CA|nr:SH3 domain-containing protein 19 isoform X2 [Mastacembelus armatus]